VAAEMAMRLERKTCPSCGAVVGVLIVDLKYGTRHCHFCLDHTSRQAQEEIARKDAEFLKSIGVKAEEDDVV